MTPLAFDFETHLIGPDPCPCGEVHDQLPPAVCLSYAMPAEGGGVISGVVLAAEGIAMLAEALDDPEVIFIGAETAFDVLVSCVNAHLAGLTFEAMITKWVAAYNAGRVHDVCVRQKLLDLAAGSYRWQRFSDGRVIRIGYDLATTAKRLAGIVLSKPTKETEATHPRLRYAEVDGAPVEQWPPGFREYAEEDATATLATYLEQEQWRESDQGQWIAELWENHAHLWGELCGAPDNEVDALFNINDQTCHALWLKAMSAEGLRTDARAVAIFKKHVEAEYVALCQEVRGYGLVRREYKRDLKRMRAEGNPYKGNKEWRALKEALEADDPEALEVWAELRAAGLVSVKHVKNMNDARALMFDWCWSHGLDIPHTEKWRPKKHSPSEYVAIDSDSCRVSECPELVAYSELVHAGKMLTTDIKQLEGGVHRPIHTHFEVCLETGRTSSAGPNVQNRARGEGKTVKLRDGTEREGRPGDRECFVPPEGHVFVDCDYPQLELFALAQVCRWTLGYSTLGDALTAQWVDVNGKVHSGRDPHTEFASLILAEGNEAQRLGYAEAEALRKNKKDPRYQAFSQCRDAAKGCNFGKPGGLGAKTMVGYAAKSYGVVLPEERWSEILELWDQQWPEMPDYFAFIETLTDGVDYGRDAEGRPIRKFNVPQAGSGRLRAGASFCAACNSWYQGLGADVAKRAGWYIFQACYVPGFDAQHGASDGVGLLGCMPQNFIHDQFLVAAPEARAQVAAERVEYWMRRAAIELMPDYGPAMATKTIAILAARWSKGAEEVRDESGALVVWEDKRLAMLDDFDSGEEETDEEESEAA